MDHCLSDSNGRKRTGVELVSVESGKFAFDVESGNNVVFLEDVHSDVLPADPVFGVVDVC